MADENLFSDIKSEFFRYMGVTSIFPEVQELARMEGRLRLVNVQVSSAISNINKFGKDGTKAFKDLSSSSKNLEKGINLVEKRTTSLIDGIYKQSMVMGTSSEVMTDLMSTSAEYGRILETETASAMAIFKEATDVSEYSLGEFSARMIASGRIAETEMESFLTNILASREQYGLASTDIRELFDSTEKYSNIVGVTGEKLKQTTSEMIKFIAAVKQVGLDTSFATDMMDKMFDPIRAQENMALLSRLGISMRDISFGDPSEMFEQAIPKLRSLAIRILETPGRVTQARLAEVYGLTLEEVNKISKMEVNRAEVNRQKTLEAYRQETQSAIETLTRVKNQATGAIMFVFNKTIGSWANSISNFFGDKLAGAGLMILIGAIISRLKTGLQNLFVGMRASLASSISEGVEDGITKGLIASEARTRNFFQTASGVTPRGRGEQSTTEMLKNLQKGLYGKETLGSSFMASFTGMREKIHGKKFGRDDIEDSQTIRGLAEESRAKILGGEEVLSFLKSDEATKSLTRDQINKYMALYQSAIKEEKDKLDILLGSEDVKVSLMEEILNVSKQLVKDSSDLQSIKTEEGLLKDSIEALQKREDKEKDATNKLKIYNQKKEQIAELSRLQERKIVLEQEKSAREATLKNLSGGGDLSDALNKAVENAGGDYEKLGEINIKDLAGQFSIFGENTKKYSSDSEIIREFLKKGASKLLGGQGPTEMLLRGKGFFKTLGLDKIFGKLTSFFPGVGGTLGKIAGFLGPAGSIVSSVLAVGGIVTGLIKKAAETNKEAKRNQEIANESAERLKNTITEGLVVPLSGIYAKFMKKTADIVSGTEIRDSLEDAVRTTIEKARLDNGELIAVVKDLNKSMALQVGLTEDMSRDQRASYYYNMKTGGMA